MLDRNCVTVVRGKLVLKDGSGGVEMTPSAAQAQLVQFSVLCHCKYNIFCVLDVHSGTVSKLKM